MSSEHSARGLRARTLPAALAGLLLCALLAACGQKGGLYLPEPEPDASQQTDAPAGAASEAAPEDEDQDREDEEDTAGAEPPMAGDGRAVDADG